MELNSQSHEGLSASSAAFAALLQHGDVHEISRPIGIYTVTHLTPHEAEREKRAALLREQDALLRMSRVAQMWNKKRIAYLEEAVDDFAMIVVGEPNEKVFNLVPDAAARHNLDTWLAGSAYSVVGPFMGLISSVSYTAIANSDIMANLATTNGWREAGATNAPQYSGGRKTMVFSAAATRTKGLTTNLTFSFTGAGTTKGCFMALGPSAVSTNDNTSGILGSAGLFAADKVVAVSDSLAVGYTITV